MSHGYQEFLDACGLTEGLLREVMQALPSPVPCLEVDSVFDRRLSTIHGIGIFPKRPVLAGEAFPVCRNGKRFNTARYVNHSDKPNAVFRASAKGDEMWMETLVDLAVEDEVLCDYSNTYRESSEAFQTLVANLRGAFAVYSCRDTGYHGGGPQGWGLKKTFSDLKDALDFMDGKPGIGGRCAAWSEGVGGLESMRLDWICVEASYPHPEVLCGEDSTDIIRHLGRLRFRRHIPL